MTRLVRKERNRTTMREPKAPHEHPDAIAAEMIELEPRGFQQATGMNP
jgi:hypothetical protein